jgi:hypothetical protein
MTRIFDLCHVEKCPARSGARLHRAALEALIMRAATRSWQLRSGVIRDLMSAMRRRAYALTDQAALARS